MQYKILASDLDGTLLYHGQVSRENWKAIAALREQGVHFVPASGRAFYEMPPELRDSPLIRYYITSDGTMVYDKQTNTTWEIPMPKPLGHWVLDQLYQYDMCMMLHADTNSYVDQTLLQQQVCAAYHMNEWWYDAIIKTNVPVPDMKKFAYDLDSIEMICAFFQDPEELQACLQTFQNHPELLAAQSDAYNLEVFYRRAGKGNALKLLAEKLGVEISETIAVGDSTNDSTMVSAAGLGLAMENGVPALKQLADRVICSNDQHAIDWILKTCF